MKTAFTVGAALALSALANTADATVIYDTTTFTSTGTNSPYDYDGHGYGTVNKLDGSGDYVAWTHHFNFTPAAASINTGTLAVTLKDDSASDGIELAFGFAENGQWAFGVVSNATYSYNLAVHSLLDGSFGVKLVSLLGDFVIVKSVLRIDYNPVASVPEPATLSLLGLGLLGAAFGCRRRVAKAAK